MVKIAALICIGIALGLLAAITHLLTRKDGQ